MVDSPHHEEGSSVYPEIIFVDHSIFSVWFIQSPDLDTGLNESSDLSFSSTDPSAATFMQSRGTKWDLVTAGGMCMVQWDPSHQDSRRMKQREDTEESRCASSSTVGSGPGRGLWILGLWATWSSGWHPWPWQGDCNKTIFMVLPKPNRSVIP